jgi:hypothetical protein
MAAIGVDSRVSGALPSLEEQVARLEQASMRAKLTALPRAHGARRPSTSASSEFFQTKIERLIEISPRTAIVEAWLVVEDEVLTAARGRGIPIKRGQPIPSLLSSLVNNGVITRGVASVIRRLNDVRNQAMHEDEFFVGGRDAREFVYLARRIVEVAARVVAAVDAAA